MNSLFDLIGSESTIHYAVLNPHDNTLYDISDSLRNITGAKDYQNKMLREVIGCLDTSDCANSAVRLDMTNKDKIIHVFECKALKKQLFVIKFKTVIDGKDKHVVLFTDTDNTSLNTKLMNDLDSIITHELRNTLNHLSLINNCLLERFSGDELDDFQELLSLSEQNVMVIDKIISIYGDIKNNIQLNDFANAVNFSIYDTIHEAVKSYAGLSKQKNLKVTICADNRNIGRTDKYNQGLLYLLFSNLINNALKYAPDQTNVDITITNTKENTKITITNKGTLDKHVYNSFFERGVKGHNNSGSGFGTYCSKLITELIKGKINVNNDKGQVQVSVQIPFI